MMCCVFVRALGEKEKKKRAFWSMPANRRSKAHITLQDGRSLHPMPRSLTFISGFVFARLAADVSCFSQIY